MCSIDTICVSKVLSCGVTGWSCVGCARRVGQPTQRAANYNARSNIEPAQMCPHANGQSAPQPRVNPSGSTHTESGKLYRKVEHRARSKVCSRQRPKRAPTKRRSPRRLRRRAPHTEQGFGVWKSLLGRTRKTQMCVCVIQIYIDRYQQKER